MKCMNSPLYISKCGKHVFFKGKRVNVLNHTGGYKQVSLNGKLQYVHRLIGFKHLADSYFEGAQINHKDGDKSNNSRENLEWLTGSENLHHAVKLGLHAKGSKCKHSKLDEKKVSEIKRLLSKGYTVSKVANMYPVSRSAIGEISRGKNWAHVKEAMYE